MNWFESVKLLIMLGVLWMLFEGIMHFISQGLEREQTQKKLEDTWCTIRADIEHYRIKLMEQKRINESLANRVEEMQIGMNEVKSAYQENLYEVLSATDEMNKLCEDMFYRLKLIDQMVEMKHPSDTQNEEFLRLLQMDDEFLKEYENARQRNFELQARRQQKRYLEWAKNHDYEEPER